MARNRKGITKEITKTLGSSSCIIIVPDAFPYDGGENPLYTLANECITALESFAVVNSKYKSTISDLNDISNIAANQRLTKEFLTPLGKFKEEILGNKQTPITLVLQGKDFGSSVASETDILIGSGQGERGNIDRPHRSTFPPSLLSKLRLNLSDQGFVSEPAPVDSPFCGREENCLNQFMVKKSLTAEKGFSTSTSLLLTFSARVLGKEHAALQEAGQKLAAAVSPLLEQMPLVRMVQMASIEAASNNDKKYIFRVNNEADENHTMVREAYIEELADSIKQSGLLHPLVLLQKSDGNYKILCGFRRYQAITRLGESWVEAKIFRENDFSREEFFNISLAENTRRRNLNPVEIGNFLESAAKELGLNNEQLAEKFGHTLGIGKPNTNVSQSTVHKYRKVNAIRTKNESPEIITDIINERLQFTIASEILAPIKNNDDRNTFYTEIIKPLSPTRAQITELKKLLGELDSSLGKSLRQSAVQKSVKKAVEKTISVFDLIKLLKKIKKPGGKNKTQKTLQNKTKKLQAEITGNVLNKSDLRFTHTRAKNKKEITLHVKIRPDNIRQSIETLSRLADYKTSIEELLKGK